MGNSSAVYKMRDPVPDESRNLNQFISTSILHHLYEDAIKRNLELSEQTDDPHANLLLGYYYHHGYGMNKRDLKKCFQYYQRSAKQQHPTAQYLLYQLFVSKSSSQKALWIKAVSDKQLVRLKVPMYVNSASKDICSSPAHKELKHRISNSTLWKKEIMKLKHSKKRLIESNRDRIIEDRPTLYNEYGYLLWILNENKDVEQYQAAANYFKKAGDMGNPSGYYNIANIIHHVGNLIGKQAEEARQYLIQAAENGHARAQFLLGYQAFYSKASNDDLDDNYNVAFNYLGMSSRFPYADTLCLLGQLHYHGLGGIRQNFTLAIELFEKAVTAVDYENHDGKILGNFLLGFMYEKGIGVEKDFVIAAHHYAIAAKMNYSMAMCRLAKLVEKDRLPNSDITIAIQYYNTVADSSDHDAASYAYYRLGKLYFGGKLTDMRDQNKGNQCFRAVQANQFFSSKINKRTTTWSDYHIGRMHENALGMVNDERLACDLYKDVVQKARSTYSIIGRHYMEKAIRRLNKLGFPIDEALRADPVYEIITDSDPAKAQVINHPTFRQPDTPDCIRIEENQAYELDMNELLASK
ncbi:ERAD-associated E3 ubiquitin-protein ligase component HRD3A [Trichoplax sp. H2]|uniref:ERAD-associated E3 ubiquitin-protein ligase component HRD3A n=1 Tax=Trichoplax adhaerens TaxID=10228 RepID=B3RU64_TRIAD|nr:hypothetical protein TRIADDRAFT_55171 [Trichoplax adhaerens]EDV25752.1 hypothetical protein TRIADDRAFT_55171 [Trichoplax adhaerens]RDD46019.1 ERAD-associated E3 ubiquitin-protein ligase component HRD3A [Trichoplax sp. H2]|eukprot:XP_002111785.1 hypothetical protein TRIADDRAFT_55171 [Trichoplax adhaerens]